MSTPPRNACPCCKLDRAPSVAFSPCVSCSAFVCETCRGEPVVSGRDGDARAWLCKSCRRVLARGHADISISWGEDGRPRMTMCAGMSWCVPLVLGDFVDALA